MTERAADPYRFLGDGEMADRVRAFDWAASPLGAIGTWPQSLRTAISMCLRSRFQLAIYWGPDLVLLYNDAERGPLGAMHPQALGTPARVCLAEIWDVVGPLFARVVQDGESTWAEDQPLVFDRGRGTEERFFTFSYSPIFEESGDVGGVLLVTSDTTERVLEHRRLLALRELSAAVTVSPDRRGTCVAALEVLDRSPDVSWAAIELADADADADATTRPAAADVVSVPLRSPLDRSELGALLVAPDPWHPLDDDHLGFLTLAAGQIAAALTGAQVHEAQRARAEASERLEQVKSEFLATASHELRTPLTLLLADLDDLGADHDAGAMAPRLEDASGHARRLQRLVDALMDFSRVDVGRLDLSRTPTDLALLTADLASAFRAVADRAGLTFEVATVPLPFPVYVDVAAWEKIVLNLLSNAIKFTFTGGIRVVLEPVGSDAVLTVQDTGGGIPEDELPRLFERFHRVLGVPARTHDGAGIGLALVDELARLHDGAVHVESELAGGTNVRVTIPLRRAPDADVMGALDHDLSRPWLRRAHLDEARAWITDRVPRPEGDRRGGPADRILVVDDDDDLRAYLRRLLEPEWPVEGIRDAETALVAAFEAPPRLILSDVRMPELDGVTMVRRLRADRRTRQVPIVLLTAHAGEDGLVEALEAGADDYLVKPFRARELVARVRAHVELADLRATVARTDAELVAGAHALDRLSSLQHVSAGLARASTAGEVAQVLVRDGRRAVGAAAAAVAAVTDDGQIEVVAAHGYSTAALARRATFPIDAPLAFAEVVRRRAPVFAESAAEVATRWSGGPHLDAGRGALAVAPMLDGDAAPAAIMLSFAEARTFTAEDEVYLATLADLGAGALRRTARTLRDARRMEGLVGDVRAAQARILAAADAERGRVERDLHDGAQQRLIAVRIALGRLGEAGAGPPAADASIDELVGEVDAAIDDIRRLTQGLVPTLLRDQGLGPALRSVVRDAPLPCTLDVRLAGRVGPGTERAVYFACLEALQNASKHGGPGVTAAISLARQGDDVAFAVTDDGRGLPDSRRGGGNGLQNMRDRVEALGGTIEIASQAGRGTVVRGRVPAR